MTMSTLPTSASGTPDCSHCSAYENDVECVQHCLKMHYQATGSGSIPSFSDFVREYQRSGGNHPGVYDPNSGAGSTAGFNVAEAESYEAQLRLSLEQRKAVQTALNVVWPWEKPLVTDGVFGPATRRRLESWEFNNFPGMKRGNRAATGYLTSEKHAVLLKRAATQERREQIDRSQNASGANTRGGDARKNSDVVNSTGVLSGLWSWRYDLGRNGIDIGYILFNPDNSVVVYDYANDSSDKGGDCYVRMVFKKKYVTETSYRYTHVNGRPMNSRSIYDFKISGNTLTLSLDKDRSDLDGDGITREKIISTGEKAINVNHRQLKEC